MSQLPSDTITPPVAGKELSKEDMIDFLNEETAEGEPETLDLGTQESEEEIEGDKEPEDKEEEDDELKEIEEELEPPTAEDLELMTPVRRREILAKYPKLFKDFPYLEKAYYRDQQFTETFPTVEDAKVAAQKATTLDQFEREIMSGEIGTVLEAVKEEDREAFNRVVDNYLPTLQRVDQGAYYHVLGNVIKNTIITMVREGKSLGEQGQPLLGAANILNQFVFGSNTFDPPRTLAKPVDSSEEAKKNELVEKERALVMRQFESVRDDLQQRADNVLRATIDGNIDPRKSMTDYVRKNASKDAFDALETMMSKDARFRALIDKLWERAFAEGFNRESQNRIKAAYLSKAKTLLPSVIKKARNDALKTGRPSSNDDERDSTPRKGPMNVGRSTSQSSGKIRSAKDIPKGMRSVDFLMQD